MTAKTCKLISSLSLSAIFFEKQMVRHISFAYLTSSSIVPL